MNRFIFGLENERVCEEEIDSGSETDDLSPILVSKQCNRILATEKIVNDEDETILDKYSVSVKENECPFSQLDILSQANTEYEEKHSISLNKPMKIKSDDNVPKNTLSYDDIIEDKLTEYTIDKLLTKNDIYVVLKEFQNREIIPKSTRINQKNKSTLLKTLFNVIEEGILDKIKNNNDILNDCNSPNIEYWDSMDEISDDENDNLLSIIKGGSILNTINNDDSLTYVEKKDMDIQTGDELMKRKRRLSYSYELFINISPNKRKEPLLSQSIEIQVKKPIMPFGLSLSVEEENDENDFSDIDNISLNSYSSP